MSKQMSNSAKRRVTVYSVGFVFVFLLSLLFPYSGDDWAWGSQIGLDRLLTVLPRILRLITADMSEIS